MFYLILIFSQMVHSYTVDFGHEILRMGFCAVRQQKRDLDKSLFVFISSFLFLNFYFAYFLLCACISSKSSK